MTSRSFGSPEGITPKQHDILLWVRRHQPVTGAQIAERFEIAPATATVHLKWLRQAGMVWRTGRAASARWHAHAQKPPPPPPTIEQVASVWHYARRCGQVA